MNVEGSDEVVEITYDREDKEPSDGIGKDDLADEMGPESFAVWYGQFEGLRESNHTSDNSDIDAYKDGHVENTSPDERVDTDASTETSVVLHANNKKFILGHHINTGIEMARNSTDEGCETDHVEDRME